MLCSIIAAVNTAIGSAGRRRFAAVDHGDLATFARVGRILFSNGNLDPWHAAGGVVPSITNGTDEVPVLWIDGGAHHLDLRAADPADPGSVTAARSAELGFLRRWLSPAQALSNVTA